MTKQYYTVENELNMKLLAHTLAQTIYEMKHLDLEWMIYLKGDLGTGKSFFSRAFIQYFLPDQKVKSPTYTIVESYHCSDMVVHHFDLYRLADPEELEYLAIRDILQPPCIALVEWPERGEGMLPLADILIELDYGSGHNGIETDMRFVTLSSFSEAGVQALNKIKSVI